MTAAEFMEKAHRAVRSARKLLGDGDLDGATNRAYYAMFHAARAALCQRGIETDDKKHGTIIGLFGQHLVKEGPLPKQLGRSLHEVQELRTEVDYNIPDLDPADAARAVTDAEAFVAALSAHLLSTAQPSS
jgi:uncharacterized protein (UPF0332 family)